LGNGRINLAIQLPNYPITRLPDYPIKHVTEVAFLRAINVGGKSLVRMAHLQEMFIAAGCRNVRTYIQSGNVLFDAPRARAAAIEHVIEALTRRLGKPPQIVFRTLGDIERLVKKPPFGGVQAGPRVKLYVAFLAKPPERRPKFPIVSKPENCEAIGMNDRDVFIISRPTRPGFFGFPNLFVEEALGVSATTRNWSTVTKIVEFARRETVDR
jgi:uncharacterized protein (DUF1697 family)